jgi:hypothetical protein
MTIVERAELLLHVWEVLVSQFAPEAVVSDSDFISAPRFLDFMKHSLQKERCKFELFINFTKYLPGTLIVLFCPAGPGYCSGQE